MRIRDRWGLLQAVVASLFVACGGGGSGGGTSGGVNALTVVDSDPDGIDYVHLAWPAVTPAPDSYELQGRQDGGVWQLVANQIHETSGRVSFDDAPEGVTFTFRVRSWVGNVASDWSNEVSFLRRVKPAQQILVNADYNHSTHTVQWSARSTQADGVVLERRVLEPGGASSAWASLPVALTDVEYVDSDASRWVDGNVYEYRVTYSKGSVTSVARVVDGPAARPYPPADVSATVVGANTVRLTWRNTSRIAVHVAVMNGYPSSGDVAVLPPTATSYDVTGVSPGPAVYVLQARTGDSWAIVNEVSPSVTVAAAIARPAWAGAIGVSGLWRNGAERAARDSNGRMAYSSGFSDYEGGSFTLTLETAVGEVGYRSPLGAALFQPGVLFDGQNHAHAIWAESGQLATCALHHSSFDGTWHDEVIAQDGCAAASSRSAAIDSAGALHVAWWKGLTSKVQYATNVSGTWKVEDVAPPGVSELLTAGIAVDPSGTPGLVMRAPGTLTSGAVYLVRRAGSGWTAELVPETGLEGSNAAFALALPAADRALIFGTRYTTTWESCLVERATSGWLPTTALPASAPAGTPLHPAVSPDGSRIAVAIPGSPSTLYLRQAGTWSTTPLFQTPLMNGEIEAGFGAGGKWWLLDGLGSGGYVGDHPPRPYVLYEER